MNGIEKVAIGPSASSPKGATIGSGVAYNPDVPYYLGYYHVKDDVFYLKDVTGLDLLTRAGRRVFNFPRMGGVVKFRYQIIDSGVSGEVSVWLDVNRMRERTALFVARQDGTWEKLWEVSR
jgi:hypothetical protein